MGADPIASILAAQHPDGYWEKPGPGYATKYRGTVWQLIFLDQLGADGDRPRVPRVPATTFCLVPKQERRLRGLRGRSMGGHRRRRMSSTA